MAEPATVARRLWRALLGTIVLALAGLAGGNAWVFLVTRNDYAASIADAPARPVAIVLGNRVFADGSVARELAERLRVGLELYRAKKVQKLFLSGAARPDLGYDEPKAMAGWLERRGVPREAMILDGSGHRTAATMADAAALGFHEVLVCTQAYHLPRALYLASHAGLDALGVVAVPTETRLADRAHTFAREGLARPETIAEVALRGVRGTHY